MPDTTRKLNDLLDEMERHPAYTGYGTTGLRHLCVDLPACRVILLDDWIVVSDKEQLYEAFYRRDLSDDMTQPILAYPD